MVRKSSYRRRPRRTFRRKTKRFSKKRFAKNNVNQLTMRAPLASRLLRVKLPWVKSFNDSLPTSSSTSYIFQGNGIVPFTSTGQSGAQNTPSAGDILPAGEYEYSQLYDKYFINGSSINIELLNTTIPGSTAQFNVVRAVLIAVPFTTNVPSSGSGGDDDWEDVISQLDNYTYDQLLAWPFAKWRMIGANTGGSSKVVFKMFRKTKSMCGLKDLRDNGQYGGQLTDGSSIVSSMVSVNPNNGFMYYLRLFNQSSSVVAPISITVRMKLYVTMTNREFNPTIEIT